MPYVAEVLVGEDDLVGSVKALSILALKLGVFSFGVELPLNADSALDEEDPLKYPLRRLGVCR